jgi:ABC-type nitrate/sulfonate/bicarbonate transport system substrate-binding protein
LNNRLDELSGFKIAVSAPKCVLLEAFSKDAKRLNADISGVKYSVMPFGVMVAALESGEVDAALLKGFYSVTALWRGHSILYQDWEVVPGDECCPAIIDQAVYVLLAKQEKLEGARELAERLLMAQKAGADALRRAIAANTAIPLAVLEKQPVPEFVASGEQELALFVEFAGEWSGRNVDDD